MEQKIESRLEEKVHLLVSKVSKYKHFILAIDIFQLETAVIYMNESKANQNNDMKNFKDELEHVMERVEEINEKMYDFEANKRNNLIFYGVPNEQKEIQPALLQKITHIIRTQLGIRRDIPVAKVTGDRDADGIYRRGT